MSNLNRCLLIGACCLLVAPSGTAQITNIGRPTIAIGPNGVFAIAHEAFDGEWKIAVQMYSAVGTPIGPTNFFVGESCSGIDVWTSDFMENVELSFRSDGILLVLMQHTGSFHFGGRLECLIRSNHRCS